MDSSSVDVLSSAYIKLREQRDALREDYEAKDSGLAKQMQEIEQQLLALMNSINTDSMSTGSAIVLRRVTKRYAPSDWSKVYELIEKHKAFGLLHKRIHDANMSEFLQEHPEEYPEGLKVDSTYAVTVKRKSTI